MLKTLNQQSQLWESIWNEQEGRGRAEATQMVVDKKVAL